MRERRCFRCSKHLDFKNYIKNTSSKTKEHLTELWNSDYIEFFCCHCYIFLLIVGIDCLY